MDRIAYGALVKRKRGEAKLTQETLALDVFGDSTRNADISRIENGKTTPQEATIQKVNAVLGISDAEMEPIRQARPLSETLGEIPTLSREELQNLAARFGIENCFDASDGELRRQLTLKADEYRDLKKQVDTIDPKMQRLSNLKAAAQDALERGDFDEVDEVLESVHAIELEEAAKTAELRAETMLLRGRVNEAYRILSATADSFASIDALEPARRRILAYGRTLRNHGVRYGGDGLPRSRELLQPILTSELRGQDIWLWAAGQNALAISLQEQGTRTAGEDGAALLAQAVDAYRAVLLVITEDAYAVDWAMTQNNLGSALGDQSTRAAGEDGAALLAQAVDAYRAALRVYTEDAQPVQWAMTQNNLGTALSDQGTHTEGEDGAALLAQAVDAYRAALRIRTEDAHPVQWAMTQNNLGAELRKQGTRIAGEDGAALLAKAVDAYRAALRVYTEDTHPVQWAVTQENLAIAYGAIADHPNTTDPCPALENALSHVEAALTVYDPDHMSYNHAKATALREDIRDRLAAL